MTCDSARVDFLNPRAIIFGFAVLDFTLNLTYVRQVELEIQARIGTGVWPYPAHWYPGAVMFVPLLLLGAAVCLAINHWWSVLLAMFGSGKVVWLLGFRPLMGMHFAHDLPLFGWQALEKLWNSVYEPQPQYLFEVLLGTTICAYALLLLWRFLYSRYITRSLT